MSRTSALPAPRMPDHPQCGHERKRLRALVVADRPRWVFDRKAHVIQALSRQIDVEIGYVHPTRRTPHWMRLQERNRYDIVWKLGFRMGHDLVNRDTESLADFVRAQNAAGTAVVATVSNSLVHFELPRDDSHRMAIPPLTPIERELADLTHAEDVAAGLHRRMTDDLRRLRVFNGVSVNNKFAQARLLHAGVPCRLVPDGVNRETFCCVRPVSERRFGVLFVSSLKKREHKGMALFEALAERLQSCGIACRAVLADSSDNRRTPQRMSRIYNEFPIFVCASRAEGGPATLLEAAACGCVPLCTPVGYSAEIVGRWNGYIVRRRVEDFVEKILHLQQHPDLLERMSLRAQDAVIPFDWTQRAAAYEQFLLDHLLD